MRCPLSEEGGWPPSAFGFLAVPLRFEKEVSEERCVADPKGHKMLMLTSLSNAAPTIARASRASGRPRE
jgi:hypothetical protein